MNPYFQTPQNQRTILSGSVRPKIFISYHHGGDQAYYNQLSDKLHDRLDLVFDNSLDRRIDSENSEYVYQQIRERFISGTSCTLVLCGAATYQRKFVDWEIKATLDKMHGLIGIRLPTLFPGLDGKVVVPNRLFQNIQSGYALWHTWDELMATPALILDWVAEATSRGPAKIDLSMPLKERNG